MKKKYELLKNDTIKIGHRTLLYRIKALRDFGDVKKGDIGGYIEKESNLSHEGDCWVYGNAEVFGNARIFDDAKIYGSINCRVWVYGNAKVHGNAEIYDNANVYDNAEIFGNATIYDNATICNNAVVCDSAMICGNVMIMDDAKIHGDAKMHGWIKLHSDADISSTDDYYIVNNVGISGDIVFFKCKNGIIRVECWCIESYGCHGITLDEFKNNITKTHGHDKFANECYHAIEMAKIKLGVEK